MAKSEIPPASPRLTHDRYYAEIATINDELAAQTDRGAAIVAVALLDEKLRQALEAAFDADLSRKATKELFDGPSAPLGTFSAKAKLAHALGLFGPFGENMADDLQLIGSIRNRFAHHLDINAFTDDRIATLCARLSGRNIVRVERDGTRVPVGRYESPADARQTFTITVQHAMHDLFIGLSIKGLTKFPGHADV